MFDDISPHLFCRESDILYILQLELATNITISARCHIENLYPSFLPLYMP